jgi:hypothetical protein
MSSVCLTPTVPRIVVPEDSPEPSEAIIGNLQDAKSDTKASTRFRWGPAIGESLRSTRVSCILST